MSIHATVRRLKAAGRLSEQQQAAAVARGWLDAADVTPAVAAAAAGKGKPKRDQARGTIEGAKNVTDLKAALLAWIDAQ